MKSGESSGIQVVAAVLLALAAQLVLRHVNWAAGLVLYLVAAVVFGLAARRAAPENHLVGVVDTHRAGSALWARRSLPLFGAALLLLIALWINADPQHMGMRVWALQLAAVVMVLAAAAVADWGRVDSAALPTSPFEVSPWTARLVLAAILVGATWFRFHNLASLPFGFWFDEADVALIARRMVEDASYRPVFIEVMPGYHGYIIAILYDLFGESVTAVRGVSAAFGVGTVFAGYLTGRELFGRSAGLILAFMIAFSRWSLTLSRVGMHNVTVPFFALMMLGLTLRAYRRRSTLDWVLAGLFAGGGMIFYSAMSASILALAIIAFVVALRSRERFVWALPRFAAALLAALIMFAPLGKFVHVESDVYFARNRITAIWSDSANIEDGQRWSAVKDNVVSYGSMLHWKGDPNGRHNLPGEPMLPTAFAALAVLGLAAAAFRLARPLGVVALAWVPLSLIPGILSLPWESPNSLRGVAAQPVSLILATAALMALAPVAASSVRLKRVSLLFVAVVLGATAFLDVSAYFGRQADDFAVWAQHSTKETMAANLIVAAGPETQSHRVGFLEGQKSMDFIVGPSPAEAFFGTDVSLPLASDPDRDALIFTVPGTYNIVDQARRMYPDAIVRRYPNAEQWPTGQEWPTELTSIEIPREAIAASLGATLTEDDGERRETSTLIVSRHGVYRFRLRGGDQNARLAVNGMALGPCADLSAEMGLAEGVHRMELISDATQQAPVIEWFVPEAQEWEPIPANRILRSEFIEGGLLGTWSQDAADPSAYVMRRIDGTVQLRFHALPMSRPYSIAWTGDLTPPEPGRYTFTLRTDDESRLFLDGREILQVGLEGGEATIDVDLPGSPMAVELTYEDREGGSNIELTWTPPGGETSPIPPWFLTPTLPDGTNTAVCS